MDSVLIVIGMITTAFLGALCGCLGVAVIVLYDAFREEWTTKERNTLWTFAAGFGFIALACIVVMGGDSLWT